MYVEYPREYLRNKVVLGLLCFQAMRKGELAQLKAWEIDLKKRNIQIAKGKKSNSRELVLENLQMSALETYLKTKTNEVFGESQIHSALNSIAYRLKKTYPTYNPKRIRGSRYSLWLEKYNLREVQYMAGHRYVSSTERYQTTHLEVLQAQLEKYHPLHQSSRRP